MRYAVTVLLTGSLLLAGCGRKSAEEPESSQGGKEPTAEQRRSLPGGAPAMKNAQSGERWVLRNRVPLMDEPAEYGNQEDFKEHMRARLPARTEVEVLTTRNGDWLKVRTGSGDDAREGWIAVHNVLRAERAGSAE